MQLLVAVGDPHMIVAVPGHHHHVAAEVVVVGQVQVRQVPHVQLDHDGAAGRELGFQV